jgi:hypothetical protein
MQEGRDGDRGAGRSAGEGSLAGFAAAPERLRGRLLLGICDVTRSRVEAHDLARPPPTKAQGTRKSTTKGGPK